MLEARKRGDLAFRDKEFKTAIDCYSQVHLSQQKLPKFGVEWKVACFHLHPPIFNVSEVWKKNFDASIQLTMLSLLNHSTGETWAFISHLSDFCAPHPVWYMVFHSGGVGMVGIVRLSPKFENLRCFKPLPVSMLSLVNHSTGGASVWGFYFKFE